MFEDCCSLGSPQILLDELTDEMYVTRLVEPFTKRKVENSTFQPGFIETQILPGIKLAIKQGRKSMLTTVPRIVRLMLDNFPDQGLSILKNEILPAIQTSIKSGGARKANDVTDLFVEISSSIPRYYRDDFIMDIIHNFSKKTDPRLRILACRLIPVVSDSEIVLPYFEELCHDSSSTVRAAIVNTFIDCTFDESIVNKALVEAINDTCIGVQQAAANVFGSIAPHLVNDFCKLLVNPNTTRNAFPSLPEVVQRNSFAEVIDAFLTAMKYDKNDAAVSLLEVVKTVDVRQESELYIRVAHELVSFYPFTWQLYSFSKNFKRKSDFIELLDPSKISNWRTRYALLKQCEEFVPDLGSSLARIAEIFSEDSVAYVRNESVNLWVSLINQNPQNKFIAVDRLMRGTWHKKMILAKVIGLIGSYEIEDVIEMLKNDPIENVRSCIKDSISAF